MGTEVLRPQDCLIERIRVPPAAFYRRSYGSYCNNNNNYAPNSRCSRKPAPRPERPGQKRRVVVPIQSVPQPSVLKRSNSDDLTMAKSGSKVIEKVTILRRGESLDSKFKSEALKMGGDNFVVCPEMVPKQIWFMDLNSDMYAGSAFAMSPSPSALPLPSFSKKKQASAIVDDSATRDLRRLLGLE